MEYEYLIERIKKLLSKTNYVVLATSSKDGIVTASQMCVISEGLTLYFQTDSRYEKAKNIVENPNVAITIGNVYFKGQAKILGSPVDNSLFINKIKDRHFRTYENYSMLPNQILIEVNLTECRIWEITSGNEFEESGEYIKVLNLVKRNMKKMKCENLKGGY